MAAEHQAPDLGRGADHALAREHAENEVGVGPGRPHRDEPAPPVQMDLERLLDRERVAGRGDGRRAGDDAPHVGRYCRLARGLPGDGRSGHRANDTNAPFDVTTDGRVGIRRGGCGQRPP